NEQERIAQTVRCVFDHGGGKLLEVLVVDAGSSDHTAQRAAAAGATVLHSPQQGRAAQMNYGASRAAGSILYFLHADSHPPKGFAADIIDACKEEADAGCFRLAFDRDHPVLKCYAWFTRFDVDFFRFGDQSLFVRRAAFDGLGGFREDHKVMEDQEIVRRIRREHNFVVLSSSETTSARRYLDVSVIKLLLIFLVIVILYYIGVDQQRLVNIYKYWLS